MRLRTLFALLFLALSAASPPIVAAEPGAEKSIANLRAAAQAGDARAQFDLGDLLAVGNGFPKDLHEAALWFRRSADQGNADAQNAMGLLYSNGQGGLTQSDEEALRWFHRAAVQGMASAQFWIGNAYERGRGVPEDPAEAAKWYLRAAEQGHDAAQQDLGELYAGGLGVPRDDAEALRWIRKAVEQHSASAQYRLGAMYEAGQGVEKSAVEAVKWYSQAADQGFTVAQTSLGESFESGSGQPAKDLFCAYFWYSLAADQGYDRGDRLRGQLAPKLTPEQIAEARRMVKASDQTQPLIRRPLCPGELVTMTVQTLPYPDLVQLLQTFTGLKVVGPEKLPGTVRVELQDVPWETAFTQAFQGFGYRWAREGETIRIVPLAPPVREPGAGAPLPYPFTGAAASGAPSLRWMRSVSHFGSHHSTGLTGSP